MTSSTGKLWPHIYEAIFKFVALAIFGSITTTLFIYLNRVHSFHFIDEAFHIRQVERYCHGIYDEWDPKITTPPGLYFMTALFLAPLEMCQTTYIRCTNLIGTILNFYLIYSIIKEVNPSNNIHKWSNWMQLALVYNLAFLPPLFFWHFLYYTDVISLSMVLLLLLFHVQRKFKLIVPIGLLAILIRQTNIVWLVFFTIERAVNILHQKLDKLVPTNVLNSPRHLLLLWKLIKEEAYKGPINFMKFVLSLCLHLMPYIIVGLSFIGFLIWNNGIVVGDKSAHVATIHVPQLFYFSLFAFVFSWPYMIVHIKNYLNFIVEHWVAASVMFVVLSVAVHTNTLVHPYVLADNRHYVFYFWKNFMGKYAIFKYLMIPVYSFTLYAMYCCFDHLRFSTQINYILMVCIVLIPQLLLEPRYFIVPYIFYRLSMPKPQRWQILLESLTTLVINILQFAIFVNKVFYWKDQLGPQRIAW